MEIYNLEDNIDVFCITADKFPEVIVTSHNHLQSIVHDGKIRQFFGISYPNENGNIIYKAAAEELFPGEREKYGLEGFTIRKGDYISKTLLNWQSDVKQISKVFQELLKDKRIDKTGYCLEMYLNYNDMICMVLLEPPQ